MKKSLVAPSILSADFSRLGEEVKQVIQAGADLIHFDVMDNHFVPNLTVGPMVCQSISKYCHDKNVPIDVHLMTDPVDNLIEPFAKAGATYISFHPEATEHIDRSLTHIHEQGCKAGLVFNPATPLDYLDYVLPKLDLILIMSVNPGFGGQKFIPEVLPKIKEVREIIDTSNHEILLAVDGGVTTRNATKIRKAGADMLVAGTAIFKSHDYKMAINALR